MMNKIFKILSICLISFISSCSKDDTASLMDNSKEYSINPPEPKPMTINEGGVDRMVNAYPGQLIVFFNKTVSMNDALDLIKSKGATVLAQIPNIGYYLIEANPVQISNVITSLKSSSSVLDVMPHTFGYLRGNVAIMDYCGGVLNHDVAVLDVLKSTGGSFNSCIRISKDDKLASSYLIIHGINNLVKSNNGKPTLINLSANGGLPSNYDWTKQDANTQLWAKWDWFYFMKNVLMTIAALPESARSNLVISIAAGNENMPIDEPLELLRQMPSLATVLKNNVLLVSTEKMNPIHANYSYADPDVVVLNNTSSAYGTSLAAPCAMGFIDSIMRAKGVSASTVLKAIKNASWVLPKREVTWNNILNMLNATIYYAKGPYKVKSGTGLMKKGSNYFLSELYMEELRITYRPNYMNPALSLHYCYENWTYQDGSLYSHDEQKCYEGYSGLKDSSGQITYRPWVIGNSNSIMLDAKKSSGETTIDGYIWMEWDPSIKVAVQFVRQ